MIAVSINQRPLTSLLLLLSLLGLVGMVLLHWALMEDFLQLQALPSTGEELAVGDAFRLDVRTQLSVALEELK